MQNIELDFDKTRHVMFSKECEKEIRNKISLNYQSDLHDEIWKNVQLKYVEFLSNWNVDLGGKKNFHNGKGGTYDCIALMSYYVVCKDKTNLQELEEMEGNLFLDSFKKMKFVNCNKMFFKKLMYKAFAFSKKKCDKWHDYQMNVGKFDKNKPFNTSMKLLIITRLLWAPRGGFTEFITILSLPATIFIYVVVFVSVFFVFGVPRKRCAKLV